MLLSFNIPAYHLNMVGLNDVIKTLNFKQIYQENGKFDNKC